MGQRNFLNHSTATVFDGYSSILRRAIVRQCDAIVRVVLDTRLSKTISVFETVESHFRVNALLSEYHYILRVAFNMDNRSVSPILTRKVVFIQILITQRFL